MNYTTTRIVFEGIQQRCYNPYLKDMRCPLFKYKICIYSMYKSNRFYVYHVNQLTELKWKVFFQIHSYTLYSYWFRHHRYSQLQCIKYKCLLLPSVSASSVFLEFASKVAAAASSFPVGQSFNLNTCSFYTDHSD